MPKKPRRHFTLTPNWLNFSEWLDFNEKSDQGAIDISIDPEAFKTKVLEEIQRAINKYDKSFSSRFFWKKRVEQKKQYLEILHSQLKEAEPNNFSEITKQVKQENLDLYSQAIKGIRSKTAALLWAIENKTIYDPTKTYRLIIRNDSQDRLGNGAFGVVTAAEIQRCDESQKPDSITKLEVAIKENQKRKKMIEHEARVYAELGDHPNIPKFYGVSVKVGCFIMEKMQIDLAGLLNEETWNKNLSTALQRITIMQQITAGLAHMHNCGYIHCDLKLENVMIAQDGTAKLVDFGLTVKVDPNNPEATRQARGTINWFSPQITEDIVDEKIPTWTFKDDIFSLALLMWAVESKKQPSFLLLAAVIVKKVCSINSSELNIVTKDKAISNLTNRINQLLKRRHGWAENIVKNANHFSTVGDEREKIPVTTREDIKTIIKNSWQQDPKDRPTAKQIGERLEQVKNDFAI